MPSASCAALTPWAAAYSSASAFCDGVYDLATCLLSLCGASTTSDASMPDSVGSSTDDSYLLRQRLTLVSEMPCLRAAPPTPSVVASTATSRFLSSVYLRRTRRAVPAGGDAVRLALGRAAASAGTGGFHPAPKTCSRSTPPSCSPGRRSSLDG